MSGVETDVKKTHVVRVPSDVAHASATTDCQSAACTLTSKSPSSTTISQSDNLAFTSQIPHDRVARAAGTSENILDLLIPGDRRDFV